MSARAERLFVPVLREVERGLLLPIPERVRILRELEYDLEALTERLVADGAPVHEARRRALEALVPDGATLEALRTLHAPWYPRLTRGLSPERLRLAERTSLALATAALVAAEARALMRVDLLENPSPFLFPVLVLGGMLAAAVLAKAFELWIKRDHAAPGRGLWAILAISAAPLILGMLGVFTDFYGLAATLERAPELAETLVTQWLLRDAVLVSVALLMTLTGAVAWFGLARWVVLLQGERRELLGLPRHHSRARRR